MIEPLYEVHAIMYAYGMMAHHLALIIILQVYRTPLLDMADGPAPILSGEEVEMIFGPICKILQFQEIFYSAVTSR